MKQGGTEWRYAEPIAQGLIESKDFRTWLIRETRFSSYSKDAEVMHKEMMNKRSPRAQNWWISHFTEKCRCAGCSGQQTDLLAIFKSGLKRFALHFEIKHPSDTFRDNNQAANYAIRAKCWVCNPPAAVLRHNDADTVLIFDESKRDGFRCHIANFGTVLTFDDIRKALPPDWDYPRKPGQ